MGRIEDTGGLPKEALADFVRRERNAPKRTIVLLFFLLVVTLVIGFLAGAQGTTTLVSFALLLVLSGIMTGYAILHIGRSHDLLTEAEFLNALFSSSLAEHSDFTLILRADGNFAYADQGFSKVFPGFSINNRTLESLLEASGVAHSDAERLYQAMRSRRRDWFMFTLANATGETTRMILNLYPLPRPDSFFLIQGRQVKERKDTRAQENVRGVSLSSYRYMHYLFNEMPMGVYALSPSGHIRAVNRVLETWLGYEEGDIIASGMAFDQLLYRADGEAPPDYEMKEYIGPIALSRRNGSLLKSRLEQHVIRDESGTILAVIGMIRDKIGG